MGTAIYTDFVKYYTGYKSLFEGYLDDALNEIISPDPDLLEAVKYALAAGGKRLRPVLFLAVYDFFSKSSLNLIDSDSTQPAPAQSAEKVIKLVAVAIEALHSYTLVHDDLPCLDNDDFRRGQPSCHKKFGEATALLAGDALLNLAFELLLKAATINSRLIDGIGQFAILTGMSGLIGGQARELTLGCQINGVSYNHVSEGILLDIYKNKTAALFVAAALMGGVCAGCDKESLSLIKDFAQSFGMSFQLKDDLADMDKNSFVQIFGRERTNEILNGYSKNARDASIALRFPFIEKLVDFEKFI